jgi:hypothetical protein
MIKAFDHLPLQLYLDNVNDNLNFNPLLTRALLISAAAGF